MRQWSQRGFGVGWLAVLLAIAGCAGVAPGSPETGYVVWGFVQDGSQVASGSRIILLDPRGNVVQEATTDWAGKYTFAYHAPGTYEIAVGETRVAATIADGDQRLDIDVARGSRVGFVDRLMQGVQQVVEESGPPSCSTGSTSAGSGGEGVERDPSLAGSWSRVESISSGDASMSTRMSLLICPEGTYVRTVGGTVGGGAGWSAESGGSDSTRGQWRTEGGAIFIRSGVMGWEHYARYYVEGGSLMLTLGNGEREVWHR